MRSRRTHAVYRGSGEGERLQALPSSLQDVLYYLAMTNIVPGIFNLIPGFPLEGGRILHSIVWKFTGNSNLSARVASLAGQVIAYLFILLGIWMFFAGNILDGL